MLPSKKISVTRIKVLSGLIVLVAMVIIGRLYHLQVVNASYYQSEAEGQYVKTEQGLFRRGTVYLSLRNGEVRPLATMQTGYKIGINFALLQNEIDAQTTYSLLQEHVPRFSKEEFDTYANEPQKKYKYLDTRLTEEEADKIRETKIKGIDVVRTEWRVYPYGELLARVIGIVGYDDNGNFVGRYGLERAYEPWLVRASKERVVNRYAEIFGEVKETFGASSTRDEAADIVTTLEPLVDAKLVEVLRNVHEKYQSEITGGIIMNPQTGEIYAMDAVPTFDPNNRKGVHFELFSNPLTLFTYEFGSIIKPLTVAAGIDAGVIGRYTTYTDTGCTTIDTRTICNYDKGARGVTDMQTVLSKSLNMGVAYIARQLGHDRFRTYFTSLQLGSETGIDAGGENAGNIQNLKTNRDIEFATASYGQGIALTPIATIRALATLANKGVLTSPRLGKEYRYVDGEVQPIVFPPGERVFSEEAANTVTKMLVEVVDSALKNGQIKQDHYSVAAKTGTSYLPIPGAGYDQGRFFHSFVGYFPAYDPKFIILLFTKDPKDVKYASDTLTDAFDELVKYLIHYYEIPPDR